MIIDSGDLGDLGELSGSPPVTDEEPLRKGATHVRALHAFRGENNDELCLKKDDIITLTQTPSGGWWEGTLEGITGWFPANYVQPILAPDPLYTQLQQSRSSPVAGVMEDHVHLHHQGYHHGQSSLSPSSSSSLGVPQRNGTPVGPEASSAPELTEYRAVVIRDIEESEQAFVQALQDAINHYLKPLYQFKIFPSETEINAVLRSITEICSVHRRFLASCDKIRHVGPRESRIGGLLLQFAPQFKHAHFEYCSHHSRFVQLVEKYKKEICAYFTAHPAPPPSTPLAGQLASPMHQPTSSSGTQSAQHQPNVIITSSLSVSFRRLDKYPALLQELQRYTEENHPDRGDTQRAGFVYRDIAMSCLELRRRKEMELEVMLGNIRNFEPPLQIEHYGPIAKMEPVSILILPHWCDPKKDCYLVLFTKVLMVLSVGNEMTSFTYESMMKLDTARLAPVPPGPECQIELTGTSAHPLSDVEARLSYVAQFACEDVAREWYQSLQKQIRHLTAPAPAELGTTSGTTTTTTTSMTSGTSSPPSSLFSPTSTTSPDQPVPTALPSRPPRPQDPAPPPLPLAHHRVKPPGATNASNTNHAQPLNITVLCQTLPRRTSFWSDQLLTPHAPWTQHVSGPSAGQQGSQAGETGDDMSLLTLIDAYHRKAAGPRMRRPSNSNLNSLELDTCDSDPGQLVEIVASCKVQRSQSARQARKSSLTGLVNKINKLSISSMDRDVLYEIYDQLRQLKNETSHLGEKLRDERRQRKRLQHLVGRLQSASHG